MADGDPIIIGQTNNIESNNPGTGTVLGRAANSPRTDPVFTVRTPVGGDGIHGEASGDTGVSGTSSSGYGVRGTSDIFDGAFIAGVWGDSGAGGGGAGVVGFSSGEHLFGNAGAGVWGQSEDPEGWGGYFVGNVYVTGNLTVEGDTFFKIDHPLEPQNKYLFHNRVESSERKNIYDGVAEPEADGTAWVDLPGWFEELNGDFRYQLTAVGRPAPNLHVAEEISENRFKIAGGEEGMKVCWQVTGTRKDPWAAANPFEVEQEKPEEERGRYLHPSLYDAPEEQRFMIGPRGDFGARLGEEHRRGLEELRRRMEERQEEVPPEST